MATDDPSLTRASEMGATAGRNLASWVFDGNTTDETYRTFLGLREDGDPLDEQFAPRSGWLSGENADDPTPQSLASDLGIDPEDDELLNAACSAYEEAADGAYWAHLEATANLMMGDD